MKGPYDDIINLPHHVSKTHPRMPSIDRAAQFAPFAALTNYEAAVKETARLTDKRAELSEYAKEALSMRLELIANQLHEGPKVSITYFEPDSKKAGGSYITASGRVKKIDDYRLLVIMTDDTKIPIKEIIEIEGEIFAGLP
ncbi:MAG: hypothetical protein GX783_04525 [Clostridiales bacterium]|nr:hypothetical protein [Clostridiales bacterium]